MLRQHLYRYARRRRGCIIKKIIYCEVCFLPFLELEIIPVCFPAAYDDGMYGYGAPPGAYGSYGGFDSYGYGGPDPYAYGYGGPVLGGRGGPRGGMVGAVSLTCFAHACYFH